MLNCMNIQQFLSDMLKPCFYIRLVLAGRARGSVSVEALQFGHLRVPMALSGAMAAAAAGVFAMEAAMAARRRIRERKRRCQGGGSVRTLR